MTRRTDFRPVSPRAAAIAVLFSLLTAVALVMPAFAFFQDDQQDDQESQPLSGVFTVTITSGDIPPNLAGGPALAGLWNVTFNGDGSFRLARQDVGEVVTGRFEAAEATLTFNEWSGLVGCDITADSGEPATYAWQQTDDRLTLTPITDSCTERLTLLTTRSLGWALGRWRAVSRRRWSRSRDAEKYFWSLETGSACDASRYRSHAR